MHAEMEYHKRPEHDTEHQQAVADQGPFICPVHLGWAEQHSKTCHGSEQASAAPGEARGAT